MRYETSIRSEKHVLIRLPDAEVIQEWPDYSHRGKTVRPSYMEFRIIDRDGYPLEVSNLLIAGRLIKKDGTLSDSVWPEMRFWMWLDGLHEYDQRERQSDQLDELLEIARVEARKGLGR